MTPYSTLAALILLVLAAVHGYWLFGGRAGLTAALPSRPGPSTGPLLTPGPGATALVALALLSCAVLVPLAATFSWARGATLAAGVAFGLRAVGDFRYLGLFKRVRGTTFARWDDRLYIPLCVTLSGLLLLAAQPA
ncbi:DUF3995 domain-containing protein [Deinococcus sedimenti]|uniref:Membrane protein n=1 Tax=Deinococcus sedimenti TaxID=1867090 RepID=A0ABQ2S802_9DEIO|nr:DUF3995 domain-containing protein [Deinococcus sedimenti]GGS04260.1 membrane protein [Deinococcus sedimenti]